MKSPASAELLLQMTACWRAANYLSVGQIYLRDKPGTFLRDIMKSNLENANFRVFGPGETASNRLDAIYEVSGKKWMAETVPNDTNLEPAGRVLEV